MIKKLLLLIIIIFAGVLFVNASGMHVSFHKQHATLAERLGLTQQQIAEEQVINQEAKKELNPLLKQLDAAHSEYNKLVTTKANSEQIINQKQKIEQLSSKYNEIHKMYMHKLETILTD